MRKIIKATGYIFGNNIDTDQIYPGRYLELVESAEIALHVMEGADPDFAGRFQPGGIIVAGTNFGCGSSREHAAIALQTAGISLVLAESFGRIFYRNCINLGLPVMVCPGIRAGITEGDLLEANLETGAIENITAGTLFNGEKLSLHALRILESGGIKPLMKTKFER